MEQKLFCGVIYFKCMKVTLSIKIEIPDCHFSYVFQVLITLKTVVIVPYRIILIDELQTHFLIFPKDHLLRLEALLSGCKSGFLKLQVQGLTWCHTQLGV